MSILSDSADILRDFASAAAPVVDRYLPTTEKTDPIGTVPSYVTQQTQEPQTVYLALEYDPTGATVATSNPSTISQIGDAAKNILGDLWGSIKTTATATVRGALEGGRAASSGAAQGAQIGAQGSSLQTTLALGIAGVVLLVLLLRK